MEGETVIPQKKTEEEEAELQSNWRGLKRFVILLEKEVYRFLGGVKFRKRVFIRNPGIIYSYILKIIMGNSPVTSSPVVLHNNAIIRDVGDIGFRDDVTS